MKHKKELHILYIITKLELGGAQKICLSLFNALQKAEHQTWLLSGTEGFLVDTVKNNPHTFLIPTLEREVNKSELRAFWDIFCTIKKLKKDYPDLIVHTHSTKAGYLGRWAAWCAGIQQIVHTVHGFGFNEYQSWTTYYSAYLLEKLTQHITTSYICVSSADITIAIKKIKIPKQKITLIRAAIEETRYLPAKKEVAFDGVCVFGTIACFKPQKNIFDLLEAFKTVRMTQEHARLEIIGDGIQRPLIEEWIKKHFLSNAIQLHGWQEEPATIMKNWDCFVLSSLWEGLPCALIEARFLKIPVVAYHVGGISDVIKHGKNGYLCPVKNKNLLSHYMTLVAQNNYLRIALGQHEDNLDAFKQQTMIDQHEALYQQSN